MPKPNERWLAEIETLLADITARNRQPSRPIWQIIVPIILVTAALVQILNLL